MLVHHVLCRKKSKIKTHSESLVGIIQVDSSSKSAIKWKFPIKTWTVLNEGRRKKNLIFFTFGFFLANKWKSNEMFRHRIVIVKFPLVCYIFGVWSQRKRVNEDIYQQKKRNFVQYFVRIDFKKFWQLTFFFSLINSFVFTEFSLVNRQNKVFATVRSIGVFVRKKGYSISLEFSWHTQFDQDGDSSNENEVDDDNRTLVT